MITQTSWDFDVTNDLLNEHVSIVQEIESPDDWLATANGVGAGDDGVTAAGNTPLEAVTALVKTLRDLADVIERGIIPRIAFHAPADSAAEVIERRGSQ